MKKSIGLAALVALVCLPALTACKSRTRSKSCTSCAPPPVTASPPMASMEPAPEMMPAPEFTGPPTTSYDPGPSSSELDSMKSDLAQANARASAAERRAHAIADENSTLRRDLDRLMDEMENDPVPAAPVMADTGPAPAPAASGKATDLMTNLRGMAGVKVEQRSANSVVVLVTDAFRSGSDKLKGDMRLLNALRDTAAAVSQHPGAQVQVVGHTDTTPIRVSGWDSNTALSMARAKTVASVLMENGVSSNALNIEGLGERQPLVAPERTASDRAKNRRVEIQINL